MTTAYQEMLARAVERHRAGDVDAAETQYREALALAPEQPGAAVMLGTLLRQAGRLDEAQTLTTEALETSPTDPALHHSLGLCLCEVGRPREGVASFQRALELAPEQVPSAYNLASALEDCGDLKAACDAYRRTIRLAPQLAQAHYNLGGLLTRMGDLDGAEASYRAAVRIDPEYAKALNNLGNVLRARKTQRDLGEAISLYTRATQIDGADADAWCNLGLAHNAYGDRDEALDAFDCCLRLQPNHATASHMAAALRGDTTVAPPDAFVAALFDDYAADFEAHLTGELGYAVPEKLSELLLRQRASDEPMSKALDLGCGTGLFGARLRPMTGWLGGIDLSSKMIEVARGKALYDELETCGIEAYLEGTEHRFDLIAASDVLVYCGELRRIFALVAAQLEPGGLFVFSTEVLDDADFALRQTGRYAHSRAYIEACARGAGLSVVEHERTVIRKNYDAPLDGYLFVLRLV